MKRVLGKIIIIVVFLSIIIITHFYFVNQLYAIKLRAAINENDLNKLQELLEKDGNIDSNPRIICLDCRGNLPALHLAAKNGNYEAVKLLVENGANVNNTDTPNNTSPLIQGIHSIDIAKFLINNGAEINYMDFHSSTAISYTLIPRNIPYDYEKDQQSTEFVVWLIEEGANVKNVSSAGNFIMDASSRNSVLTVEYLLENNLSFINEQNSGGYTPLMYASMGNATEVVKYLLNHGADKSLKNENGETALDLALERNNEEIIALLSS